MTKELIYVLIAAIVLAALASALKGGGRRKASGDVRKKKLLTEREQPMYFRLKQAFPDDVVLCQVAFSALITARDQATRAKFNRKVADFVVATRAFEVLAVIELDDSSHHGREAHDSNRDSMLEQAGYRVLRFRSVPDIHTVQKAVRPPLPEGSPAASTTHAGRS